MNLPLPQNWRRLEDFLIFYRFAFLCFCRCSVFLVGPTKSKCDQDVSELRIDMRKKKARERERGEGGREEWE